MDTDLGGEGELPSRLSATMPTTREATDTMPRSPIATCVADNTRDLGAVAVAGGGSAGMVSSTLLLIVQTELPNQECGRVSCVVRPFACSCAGVCVAVGTQRTLS